MDTCKCAVMYNQPNNIETFPNFLQLYEEYSHKVFNSSLMYSYMTCFKVLFFERIICNRIEIITTNKARFLTSQADIYQ